MCTEPALLADLAAALTAASGGTAPTPVELAELLWLAGRLEDADRRAEPSTGTLPDGPHPSPAPEATPPPLPQQPPPRTPPKAPTPAPPGPGKPDRVPLYLDQAEDTAAVTPASLLAPAPPMLRHPLPLQRALRPLKRRVPSPTGGRVLDERATADRIARLGAHPSSWLPVMRPSPERWLRLALLHDTGPTMPVWRPLVRELHTALAQSGVFRTVSLHRATPDGRVEHLTVPHDGRTVALLLSDCTGPQWREGEAGRRWLGTLHSLATRMPLAVVQPLPEHLWRTTALPARPGLLTAPHAAAPLSSLGFTPYAESGPGPSRHPGSVPLPVLEPGPAWLANWSRLTATTGGVHVPGAAAWLPPSPVADEPREDVASLTPEELVLRFRATASPQAFRLAGHLAVGVPHLPVMRLVHAALEPEPRPQHLAEVILSGMLTTTPGPPGSYAFRDGVRDLLLRSLPRTARGRTSELLLRVGALIDERAGVAAGEFRATTRGAAAEAFATVSEESVRRLSGGTGGVPSRGIGGRYRLLRRLRAGGTVWQARDEVLGRVVAVKLYGAMPARQHRAFLDSSRVLADVDHPNVVKVHHFGVEDGTAYTVMEYLDGVALNTLAVSGGYRLPTSLRASVVTQLTYAVKAVHAAGITHGRIGMPQAALLPDGTVKLTLFAPGGTSDPDAIAEDLYRLGSVINLMNKRASSDRDAALQEIHRSAAEGLLSRDAARQEAALAILLGPQRDHLRPALSEQRHYRLLGPLTVTRNATPLTPSAPALQSMLGMLLLRNGSPVSRGELLEGLWDAGRRPDRADALLGTYASRLRNALGPGTLATLPDGYALHTSADTVDIVRCQDLAARAESARAAGDLPAARDHVAEALSLWRGTPLDGVPGPAARTARTRLTQLHLTLLKTRAELDLDLGHFQRAATDLTALVRDHPSREDFRRLQLIALHRLGRTDEALESYEEYEAAGGLTGSALAELHRDLREAQGNARAASRAHTSAMFRFAEDPVHPDAHTALGRAVALLIVEAGLGPDEHGLLPRPDGHEVRVETEPAARRLLTATLQHLEARLWDVPGCPRLIVTFWPMTDPDRPEADILHADLDAADANAVVAVPPALRAALPGGATVGTRDRYWRVFQYLPQTVVDEGTRNAVRGPQAVPPDGELPRPAHDHAVIVYRRPDGTLTRTPPTGSAPVREFYEVDVTQRSLFVDAGHGARVTVRVTDPVEAALHPDLDLAEELTDRLETELGRAPTPLNRRALAARLQSHPLPGYTTRWHLHETESRPASPSTLTLTEALDVAESSDVHALDLTLRMQTPRAPSLAGTLAAAEVVLLGFDGPLVQLYAGVRAARNAARELAELATELRDPEEALSGDPLRTVDTPMEVDVHPLDVLRTFAGHRRLAQPLRERLDAIELRALRTARPTRDADRLLRALGAIGRPVSVVSDVSPHVVSAHLQNRALTVHGRADDPRLLMPNPDVLHRALHRPGSPTPHAVPVLIGSSPAELTAARTLGIPFIGYAPNRRTATRLTTAGPHHLVHNLAELIEALPR
ncbi:SAV_2336 N-terminal domain-related protein [Streptomyces sp. NPDC058067]|uniref:SAV_2336 N-terminal domain-related protein n=1 Tax=Streptomyces sp. NPDC058067 TaxID=3346324 RepID=UPI0036ED4531